MKEPSYDYLVVGSGLFGAVFAHEMKARGKRVLVLERRDCIGGNCATTRREGIDVHVYGPHIFHTDKRTTWDYVNALTPFRPFVYSPVASYHGELYSLPFNLRTFYALWGVRTPEEAAAKLAEQRAEYADIEQQNLEEQALSLVGRDIYEKLIQGYTEKQWGRPCTELPAFIIRRLPVRLTFDANYFNDRFQGIPEQGYTALIEALLDGIEVRTGTDFLADRAAWEAQAAKVVYTGRVDAYFGERLGALEYRSLRFEHETLEQENYQGIPVMNYTSKDEPFTRIIEHKHFLKQESPVTIVSREHPDAWSLGKEPYYPVNDAKNNALYERYAELAAAERHVLFGGRLGTYRYYNMDQVIEQALAAAKKEEGTAK